LSLAIYRVTARFPAGEVLARQMRQLGNEIAAELNSVSVATGDIDGIKKDINCLRVYFQIAKAQNWVKPINWSILDFEYYKLEQEVDFCYRELTRIGNIAKNHEDREQDNIMSHNIKEKKEKARRPKDTFSNELSGRQEKILETLNQAGSLKMSEIIPLFGNSTSERTLRNEITDLAIRGLLKKNGSKKAMIYYRV